MNNMLIHNRRHHSSWHSLMDRPSVHLKVSLSPGLLWDNKVVKIHLDRARPKRCIILIFELSDLLRRTSVRVSIEDFRLCTVSLCLLSFTIPLSVARPSHFRLVLVDRFLHLIVSSHFVFEKAEQCRNTLFFGWL
jgi:hypothetical protein